MTDQERYLKVGVEAAKQAGGLFSRFFGKPKDVKFKNHDFRDQVTEVDLKIETLIRRLLAHNFPDHKIIGEEFGRSTINKEDLVWIIDPIDGTTNFIQGIPICCISICLWDHKGPVIAVLYNPVLNKLYTASRGRGAKLNGKTIKVSKERVLARALGGLGWLKLDEGVKLFTLMAKHCRKLRILASSAWQISLVGSANYDFHVSYDINVWEIGRASCRE